MITKYDLGATVLVPMKIVSISIADNGILYYVKRQGFKNKASICPSVETIDEGDIYGVDTSNGT